MSDQWRDAVQYRNRAAVLRSFADEIDHDEHRLALRKVAAHYDRIAVALERELKAAPA